MLRVLLLVASVTLSQGLRSTDVPVQEFRLGDHVEVRDSDDESWKVGVVSSLDPIKVTADGWDVAFRWRFVRPGANKVEEQPLPKESPSEQSPSEQSPSEESLSEEPQSDIATDTSDQVLEPPQSSLPAGLAFPQRPLEPGCYVWMPSGCSKNAGFSAQLVWRRDEYGETSKGAGRSKRACQARQAQFNSWCGVGDAQTLFVGRQAPVPPTTPGCYVFHPSGCPNHELKGLGQWTRDLHGEERFNAGADQSACIGARKKSYDAWCGADDTEMTWVSADGLAYSAAEALPAQRFDSDADALGYGDSAPPAGLPFGVAASPQQPDESGCYVWMPTGCSKNGGFSARLGWKRDEYGEANKGAGLSRSACHARQAKFNSWCGTSDAQMLFVPRQVPAPPTEAGCYVFHTSGCTSRQLKGVNRWLRDEHGEENFNARSSQTACVETRKKSFDTWCGVDDTQMVWVGQDGSTASSPAVMQVVEPSMTMTGTHGNRGPTRALRVDSGDELPVYVDDDDDNELPVYVDDSVSPAKAPFAEAAPTQHSEASVGEAASPKYPEESGCYVWMPTGCSKNGGFSARLGWKRDEYGEANKGAGLSRSACHARQASFNTWCGASDAQMLFVPRQVPAPPTEAGCYVFHTSGCTSRQLKGVNRWLHDEHGEANFNARSSQTACVETRKKSFDTWCGVDDTQMVWVGQDGSTASSPAVMQVVEPSVAVPSVVTPGPNVDQRRTGGLRLGDEVEVRDHADDAWKTGVVSSTDPVKVTPDGWDVAFKWRFMRPKGVGEAQEWTGNEQVLAPFQDSDSVDGAAPAGWLAFPHKPAEPGCYVWMPSGCSKNPGFSGSVAWKRDEYGEANAGAAYSKVACQTRQAKFNTWCAATDAQMLFVPRPVPTPPREPGCYVFHPGGCPGKQLKVVTRWVRDEHGEERYAARESQNACLETRKASFDTWCGVDDTLMIWVSQDGQPHMAPLETPGSEEAADPESQEALGSDAEGPADSGAEPQAPQEPGCYRWFPSGCRKRQLQGAVGGWVKDSYGEEHFSADTDERVCKEDRKKQFDLWCGSWDTRMLYVRAEAPAEPTEPGCYVYMPSGCPRRNTRRTPEWTHDTVGESKFAAGIHAESCTRFRKMSFDDWCGTNDTMMTFVADPSLRVAPAVRVATERPGIPQEPGCYAWHKSGCRFGMLPVDVDAWVRDTFGEERFGAKGSSSVCEFERKKSIDKYCSTDDTEMLFVPPRAPPAPTEPGCYVWQPSGCPNQMLKPRAGWERDEIGEQQFEAKVSGAMCEVLRKRAFDTWCGTLDTLMMFVGNASDDMDMRSASSKAYWRTHVSYVSAAGDPHMKSTSGRLFDIKQPGEYPLVQVPRGGPPMLSLVGTIQSVGNPCSLFITQVTLLGSLFGDRAIRIRAARHNPYERQREKDTAFGLQLAPGEPWIPLSNFTPGEENIKTFGDGGWQVTLSATREQDTMGARERGHGDDADTQGFFTISIKAPGAVVDSVVKVAKRRAWMNVNVGRLDKLGQINVGGVLGSEDPDEKWLQPTKACRRHERDSRKHHRSSSLLQMGTVARHDGEGLQDGVEEDFIAAASI